MIRYHWYLAVTYHLGNEITNGVDLLCAMISSAVTTNYRTGLEAAHLFIPLIRNEKILLTNLVKVLADKVNSSRNNVIPLLDQSKSSIIFYGPIMYDLTSYHMGRMRVSSYWSLRFIIFLSSKRMSFICIVATLQQSNHSNNQWSEWNWKIFYWALSKNQRNQTINGHQIWEAGFLGNV